MALTRQRLYALLAAGAVLVAVIAALIAWHAWSSPDGPALEQEPVAATALLLPEQHLFADAVRARLELVIDRKRVDPETVDIGANFEPYQNLRPPHRTRDDSGPLTRIRYDYVLACLRAACLPKDNPVELPGAALQFKVKGTPELQTATVEWPPIRSAGRIDPKQLEQSALRAELRDLPPPSYRISPLAVQVIALLLAILCFAGAAILAIRFLPLERMTAWLNRHRADRRTTLERALALVREKTGGGQPEDGRRALERLAHELRNVKNPELAGTASELAWSEPAPAEPGVEPLSQDVERVIAEERGGGRCARRSRSPTSGYCAIRCGGQRSCGGRSPPRWWW